MRFALAVLVVAAASALIGAAARSVTGATAWPGSTVAYADLTGASGYHAAVASAVRAWNAAAVGVRFVPAAAARAQVRIVAHGGTCLGARAGAATAGFQATGAEVTLERCPAIMRPLLVAHELGVVLGLPVARGACSLMAAGGTSDGRTFAVPGSCSRWAPPTWLPALLDPATVVAARTRYLSPPGPLDVRLTAEAPPRVDWRQPAAPRGSTTEVLRGEGSCPTELELAGGTGTVIYDKPAFAGLHWTVDTTLPAVRETVCYAVFTVSPFGRSTRQPGLASFPYAPPPVAQFTAGAAAAGSPVAFTDESSSPGGSIVRWHWDFGDPASGTADTLDTSDPTAGRAPAHTYAQAGVYTVTLTVTDDLGHTATATQQVTVQ